MTDSPSNPRMSFETHADPDQQVGSYANALAIWHTAHEFTFDFLVSSEPPQPARIRIPPTAVFDIIRTVNQNLTLYEQRFGQIRPPGAQMPLYPPDDPADG